MFCPNCGKPLPDGSMKCESCGWTPIKGATERIEEGAKKVEKEIDSAVDEVEQTIKNATSKNSSSANTENTVGAPGRINADGYVEYPKLKDDRSLCAYILLSIITCGIYGFFFIHSIAKDINIACEGDGEQTAGLGKYILLSIITCGIYNVYWVYKLSDRLYKNAPKYGLNITESGTTMLLWMILGYFTGGIGTYIGYYFMIHNSNLICAAYNKRVSE